jgi:ubiquinone/menaquinone biosynthesis C-methylase UbiE
MQLDEIINSPKDGKKIYRVDISEEYCNTARKRHEEPYQISLFL